MSASPIKGALPIPIRRILTPWTMLSSKYDLSLNEWAGLVFVAFRSILLPSRSLLVSSEAIKIASDDQIRTAFSEKSGRRIGPNR